MSHDQFTILSTRPLSKNIVKEAAEKNVCIEEIEFITTEAITDDKTISAIKAFLNQAHTVIFTSMNAVEVVAAQVEKVPNWRIYSMGNTTRHLVHKYFGDVIIGTGHDATDLADFIVANKEHEAVFFCGDKRREELPDILHRNNVLLKELVVYKTVLLEKKITRSYDGILFYSPSAVESFFKTNTLNNETVLFAIGATTAASIRKYSSNQIIIGDEAGKDKLVEKALSFYQDKPNIKSAFEKNS